MENKGNKNRKVGILISLGIHSLMAIIFFLMLAWTAPDPPIPQYGIELSFTGLATESQESTAQLEEAVAPAEETVEPSEENQIQESSEQTASQQSEDLDEQPTETEAEENLEDIHSPDIIEPVEEEVSEVQVEKEDDGEDAKTSEATESDNNVEEQEKEAVIDERAIFKKNESSTSSERTGSSLDLAGWNWDFLPEPKDESSENGTIVFQITIDAEGEIIGIKTLEKTVSPVVEKVYRDAVMDLTFSKTSDNRKAAATSTGKITFIIQSN